MFVVSRLFVVFSQVFLLFADLSLWFLLSILISALFRPKAGRKIFIQRWNKPVLIKRDFFQTRGQKLISWIIYAYYKTIICQNHGQITYNEVHKTSSSVLVRCVFSEKIFIAFLNYLVPCIKCQLYRKMFYINLTQSLFIIFQIRLFDSSSAPQ